MKVTFIIPAAGLGTRMAAVHGAPKSKSKQFDCRETRISGQPGQSRAMRAGERNSGCAAKNETADFQKLIESEGFKKPVRVVEGGEHHREFWPMRRPPSRRRTTTLCWCTMRCGPSSIRTLFSASSRR